MAEFSKYVCWDSREAATLISTEAVSPATSVFFATHAALQIHRTHIQGGNAAGLGAPVDEHAVRRDFLNRPTPNGVLLMPVIGDSGTGKSHLVRWIKECTPSNDKRRVIYLPKLGTSLKSVVTALLDGVEGEDFDKLRSEVAEVVEQRDAAGLQNRLLNQLQEAILAAEPPIGAARFLVSPTGLPALLLDPHVRSHLLEPQRLIPQLVSRLLADRRDDEPERPQRFTLDDLPRIDEIDDPDHASLQARRLLGIINNRPELQPIVVELLNANLDTAVLNATVGIGRLQRALLDVRRLYAQQGKEIVLLIEDFALVQGLQRDLLDAIIEVGFRDGKATLAPIRTLLAVTPGYFAQLADTVLTRARAASPHMYDLDKQFDGTEMGTRRLMSFVGRYLNAARLGRDRLEKLAIHDGGKPPNACDDCAMATACHAGFGVTDEGHGLYPFNRAALMRAIHSTTAPEKPDAIVPRAILGAVVRNVLQEHAKSLREGAFPDGRFRQDYPTARADRPLPSAVQHAIDEADRADAARRKVVLEFWGDAPIEVLNLAPEIHSAFALPHLVTVPKTAAVRPIPTPEPQAKAEQNAAMSPSQRRVVQDIEEWQTRSVNLRQATAGELRKIISDAVSRRCDWSHPISAEPTAGEIRAAWPVKSTTVSIDGADAENQPGTANAPIKLKRTPANAQFLTGLVSLSAGQIAGNGVHLRRLQELADTRASSLKVRVREVRQFADEQLVLGLRAALLGALLAGKAHPAMSEPHLINAVIADGAGWHLDDGPPRTEDWLSTLDTHLKARRDLTASLRQAFGYAQGSTGQIRMIDTARLLPLLRSAAGSWTWAPVEGQAVPKWARPAVRGFNRLPALIDEQMTQLHATLLEYRRLLPVDSKGRDVVKAVAEAHAAGFRIGEAPDGDAEFIQLLGRADDIDWASIERLEQDVAKWNRTLDEPARKDAALRVVGQDHGRCLVDAIEFLQRSDRWLTVALQAVSSRAGATFTDAADEVKGVTNEWTMIRKTTNQATA